MNLNKTHKIELHEKLTSMNSLSYSIISYGVFYGIKQAAFFYTLFAYLIPNNIIRAIPSLFFGYFISRAMLNTSVNISEKKEWVIVSIAVFDFLVLCVITDILKQNDIAEITNRLLFCAFVTYLGFWLNKVFVDKIKHKRKEAIQKQKIADTEQYLAEKKQEAAILNNTIAEKKKDLAFIEQQVIDRICPHCTEPFPSKKARDAHKGRCKKQISEKH